MELFQVCIPTYNRVDLVRKLINSIPGYVNIFLSDNGGSISNSQEVMPCNVTIFEKKPAVDVFTNWRLAAGFSSAEWFFLPSDDDIYCSNMYEEVCTVLEKNPEVGMVVFGCNFIDQNGEIIGSWTPPINGIKPSHEAFDFFSYGVNARMPSILINRDIYNQIGGISEDFKLTAGDSELVQHLAIHAPVLFIPKIISSYRVWDGGLTHQKIASEEWRDEIDLWMQKLDASLKKAIWGNNKLWRRHIQDDIRLQNANAGLSKIVGLKNGVKFLFLKNYPFFARPKTHAYCLIQLVKCMTGRH